MPRSNLATSNDCLTAAALEDELLIWSWGKWAREGTGKSYPAWVVLMLSGYRETSKSFLPDIDDDYAMKLDRMIATLPEETKNVIYSLYVIGISLNRLAAIQGRSSRAVAQDRDFALAYLYGSIKNH